MSLSREKFLISCICPSARSAAHLRTKFKCSCVNLGSTRTRTHRHGHRHRRRHRHRHTQKARYTYANDAHTRTRRQSLQLSNKQGPARLLSTRQEASNRATEQRGWEAGKSNPSKLHLLAGAPAATFPPTYCCR